MTTLRRLMPRNKDVDKMWGRPWPTLRPTEWPTYGERQNLGAEPKVPLTKFFSHK